jgi:hypothetical protein
VVKEFPDPDILLGNKFSLRFHGEILRHTTHQSMKGLPRCGVETLVKESGV